MKILIAGTPAVAIPTLKHLVTSTEHTVCGVLTREDAPAGRKHTLTPSPLASAAESMELPIIKANRVTPSVIAEIETLSADVGVVVAYGALLSQAVLDALPHGWINLHFSALPRWRGAAPVQRALVAGDTPAVTVFQLVKTLDAGPIWAQQAYATLGRQTAGELLTSLAELGATVVDEALAKIAAGATATEQPVDSPTPYAAKVTTIDAEINWAQRGEDAWRQFAAATPEPGAFTWVDGQRCKILALQPPECLERTDVSFPSASTPGEAMLVDRRAYVAVADGALELVTVQPDGKRPMSAADWLRGRGKSVRFMRHGDNSEAAK